MLWLVSNKGINKISRYKSNKGGICGVLGVLGVSVAAWWCPCWKVGKRERRKKGKE
jgi:hypothetical protein